MANAKNSLGQKHCTSSSGVWVQLGKRLGIEISADMVVRKAAGKQLVVLNPMVAQP